MDLCRGTQEVEAVLSESNEETGAYDPLDRLKMAMNYEEKKVHDINYTFLPCLFSLYSLNFYIRNLKF